MQPRIYYGPREPCNATENLLWPPVKHVVQPGIENAHSKHIIQSRICILKIFSKNFKFMDQPCLLAYGFLISLQIRNLFRKYILCFFGLKFCKNYLKEYSKGFLQFLRSFAVFQHSYNCDNNHNYRQIMSQIKT